MAKIKCGLCLHSFPYEGTADIILCPKCSYEIPVTFKPKKYLLRRGRFD